MRRIKPSVMMLMAPVAMALLMGLAGCVADYGYGGDPEWDGTVFVGGGYGHDRDYRGGAFHNEGGRPAAQGSDRGRASMGGRADSGGGHAPSGGGHR